MTLGKPDGAGAETILTVRRGGTIVTETRSKNLGTTQSQGHAGPGPDLPSFTTYGSQIDPLAALRVSAGHCARRISPVRDGRRVLGRRTLVLSVGADPCPSADTPQDNGPATFLIDAQSSLVLDAKVFAPGGHTLVQHIRTTELAYGAHVAAALLTPPKSVKRSSPKIGAGSPPVTSGRFSSGTLRAIAASMS